MGFDYALVHLKYTIPPAIALTLIYRPLCARIDAYKVLALIVIAITATIPWDSYLIRQRIWTYPANVIVGPTLFDIPAEEVFFFFIQTYNTSLLYLLLNKSIFKPSYLYLDSSRQSRARAEISRRAGQLLLAGVVALGAVLVYNGGQGTYLGLIFVWAGPFALMLWSLSYQFLVHLPLINTLAPVAVPTLYLWMVDTLALRRGTWSIETGTKFGIHIWEGLEIEEAVFFLATNVLIVFGLVAFEYAMAVLETFPHLFPNCPAMPSPWLLIRAICIDHDEYDRSRVVGIQEAVSTLQRKSRSFYLASSVFTGRLRIDLILLYSFCRVADDLVDNATDNEAAKSWILLLHRYLDLTYKQAKSDRSAFIDTNFPPAARSALHLLPTGLLSSKPLYDLLEGFRTDLGFTSGQHPIATETSLMVYASRVAGTVAELCLELVLHHCCHDGNITQKERDYLIRSGGHMGVALQYVNIVRDVATDAEIGRVYIPTAWLKEEDLEPQDVVCNPNHEAIAKLRSRVLGKAFNIYEEAKESMNHIPRDARAPMKVAVESYMEIGRCMRESGYQLTAGRATVPKLRRIGVAWRVLSEG